MGKLIELNNTKGFSIKAKNVSEAEILIYDEIGGGGFFSDAISAKEFTHELNELPSSISNINLRINSPGGDVFDGFTIYNRLKQHKAKITVHIDGLAASIASVIAMAGDEIIMNEGSFIMIHKSWSFTAGNATDLEEMAERLLQIDEQLLNIYHRKTRMDKLELRNMIAAETWIPADEAVEMGFASETSVEEAVIAASATKAKWLKNTPQIENKNIIIKDKITNFKNDIERYLARK